jgi:hypothetical protein
MTVAGTVWTPARAVNRPAVKSNLLPRSAAQRRFQTMTAFDLPSPASPENTMRSP